MSWKYGLIGSDLDHLLGKVKIRSPEVYICQARVQGGGGARN